MDKSEIGRADFFDVVELMRKELGWNTNCLVTYAEFDEIFCRNNPGPAVSRKIEKLGKNHGIGALDIWTDGTF